MRKQNSDSNLFNDSFGCVINMRRLTQFCPTSLSTENLSNSNYENQYNYNDSDSNYDYIPPSATIHIETNIGNKSLNKKITKSNHRFGFLIEDINTDDRYNNNVDTTFKMKYQLPNMETIQSPSKAYKPIQVVSFMKK